MREGSTLAGKFRLISLLGRGGMGEVWRADHLGLKAPVAVKLISLDIASHPEALTRFHREAQSAANLRSPHVVQILDHGVDEASQAPYIVMELLEGESLSERIARAKPLPPAETARHITHIARALSRAHELGIVHRDLKPDNVFLVHNEDDEIAKVLDFGVAKWKLSGDHTQTGSVLGTPYYMSPEQISDSKDIDHRSDLWALGVIGCLCMTGHRPFQADNVVALGIQICSGPRVAPSSLGPVPEGFDAWFARATHRDVSARFQSARELANELRALCSDARRQPIAKSASAAIAASLIASPAAETPASNSPVASPAPKNPGPPEPSGSAVAAASVVDVSSTHALEAKAVLSEPAADLPPVLQAGADTLQKSVGPLSRTSQPVFESAPGWRVKPLWLAAAALVSVAALVALGSALFTGSGRPTAQPQAPDDEDGTDVLPQETKQTSPPPTTNAVQKHRVEVVPTPPAVHLVGPPGKSPQATDPAAAATSSQKPPLPKTAPTESKAKPAPVTPAQVTAPRPKPPTTPVSPSTTLPRQRKPGVMDTRK